MTDLRQTDAWAKYLSKIGWAAEKHLDVIGYLRKIPLTPVSILKIQRIEADQLDHDWLKSIQKKHTVVVTYIELNRPVDIPGFKKTWSGMLPTKTRVIDVSRSEDQLLTQMKPKTRYNLKLTQKNGLVAEVLNGQELLAEPKKVNELFGLINQNARRIGLYGISKNWFIKKLEAFGDKAYAVLVARDQILAGAIFLTTNEASYYFENGSTQLGRQLFAPTMVVWAGILEAKHRGLSTFDFDGVSDERHPTKSWVGFTRFKDRFGGKEVYFPQALVQYRLPF